MSKQASRQVFTDRTRIIEFERCPRRRWLGWHERGLGIASKRTPLPLCVGGAVHAGLEVLLREGQEQWNADQASAGYWSSSTIEEHAVAAALAEFRLRAESGAALELDASEQAAMQPTAEAIWQAGQMQAQAKELGMAADGLGLDREQSKSEFDRYLYAEQSALVEGLVRAYARRRLRPLLEQFEVMEVEREGEWLLSKWDDFDAEGNFIYQWACETCGYHGASGIECPKCHHTCHEEQVKHELWFMSRPDALLRERTTNELYLLSYKTIAQWDVRKARDIEHDMQGLSEGVEVERRLAQWWDIYHKRVHTEPEEALDIELRNDGCSKAIGWYLAALPAPPRIHAIRYEFLLKGERWEDRELSARLGMTVRSQRSHLIRQYVATSIPKKGEGGYAVGDVCWSWDYYRPEDDREGKLAWQNWRSQSVFHPFLPQGMMEGGVREWIDQLDRSELLMSGEDSTVGLEPRVLGWKSEAQAMGVTRAHPLDSVFVPPVTVWRNEDDLRDWYEQTAAQERAVAEAVAAVEAAGDDGERRHLMNVHFPMYRHSCSYPSECQFVKVCYGGPEAKGDAMATGQFREREANHPQELVQITKPIP